MTRLELYTLDAVCRRTLRLAVRHPARLVAAALVPLALAFGLAAVASPGALRGASGQGLDPLAFYFPGALVLAPTLLAALLAGRAGDPEQGLLVLALSGPGARASVACGVTLGLTLPAFAVALLLAGLSPLAGVPYGAVRWATLASVLALVAVGVSAFSVALGWAAGRARAPALLAFILAGAFVPAGALVPQGQGSTGALAVALVDPLAWAVAGVRSALGSPAVAWAPGRGALLAFALSAVVAAAWTLSHLRPGRTPR
jgi:hypothetical protein